MDRKSSCSSSWNVQSNFSVNVFPRAGWSWESYRREGLGAAGEDLGLQLEHAQVDVGGRCGGTDVPHDLQSLQDVLVLLLPVAPNQGVGVAVGRQDACRGPAEPEKNVKNVKKLKK